MCAVDSLSAVSVSHFRLLTLIVHFSAVTIRGLQSPGC